MSKVYCLKKKEGTEEFHLFECEKTDKSCQCPAKSICGKMKKSDAENSNEFSCQSESSARIKSAAIGREVCGTCVSHLYETYD